MRTHGRPGLLLLVLVLACRSGPLPEGHGGRLLIVSDRGGAVRVYEIDPDDGTTRLLGSPRADDAAYQDAMPARLGDGRVVLVSDRDGRQGLYLVSRDGERAEPLSPASAASDSDPAPLGHDRVVFARSEAGAPRDLYLIGIDGSGLRQLTRHPADDGAPCATPDGRSVVFVSGRDGTPRLYRLSPDAADPEATVSPVSPPPARLARTAAAEGVAEMSVADGAPACLPGGSIAFARGPEGGPVQIYLADPIGGRRGVRQITDSLTLPYGAGEPVSLGEGTLLMTAGPGPGARRGSGPRFAAYTIAEGGYNLARVTRVGAGYNDFARRLQPSR